MPGLLGDLLAASRALAAQQAGVEAAGRNISNVNTPGYARQRVNLADRGTVQGANGPESMGVEVRSVQQIRDVLLDIQVIREGARGEYLSARQSALQKAQAALGEQIDRSSDSAFIDDASGSTNGIASALNDFFNAFDHLASNPTDDAARQLLLQKANSLASKLNLGDSRLAELQGDLTTQINTDATKANDLLKQIADLNKEIQGFEFKTPGSALDLRDQRQRRLEELSKYMNFTSTELPNSGGQLEITAKDTNGADVILMSRGSIVGSFGFNGTAFTGGGSGATLALTGGSLQGNLSARDGEIQQLRDNLKTTANQLAVAVNGAYNPTSSATGNFFKVPPAGGIIQIDPTLNFNTLKASDTGSAGANELALAVAELAGHKFSIAGGDSIDGTVGGYYGKLVTGLGQTISDLDSQAADQKIVQAMVTQQRESVSGVSMDEEVTDLMRYQRAYQGCSRVLGVIDSMLETLINSVG